MNDMSGGREFRNPLENGSVSIVMTYYNRMAQLLTTLQTFCLHRYEGVEVIVVDDGSEREPLSSEFIGNWPFPVKVVRLPAPKWYKNPCVPYNCGLRQATNDIIIIQNSECAHAGDVVDYARKNLDKSSYLSYACYSLDKGETQRFQEEVRNNRLVDWTASLEATRGASFDGDNAWYNHSVHRPTGYHFCAAITRGRLLELNGFDERYARGVAFDDDEFLCRVKRLGLNVAIVDDVPVIHQYHLEEGVSRRPWYSSTRNEVLFRLVTKQERTCRPSRNSWRYKAFRLLAPLLIPSVAALQWGRRRARR